MTIVVKFLLGVKMAPRETENNAYAKFWGDKQRALWYVMVFSGVVSIIARVKHLPADPLALMWMVPSGRPFSPNVLMIR